jgi:hypothetical protein
MAAGFPGLPFNYMFIKDVNMNTIRVLNLASVHIKDVEYVDCVQQYFSGRKQQRAYCSTCADVVGLCS